MVRLVPADSLQTLVDRYDPQVLALAGGEARVRLVVEDEGEWDAVLDGGAVLAPAAGEPSAILTADAETWRRIAADLRGGMDAFRAGRLRVRRNLHVGVGFLAATSGMSGEAALRFSIVPTATHRLSTLSAGSGIPVIAIHGLGATKASFLPTVAALADGFRVTAVDLPGFGDSDKPLGAPYDARWFAKSIVELLDALGLERASVIGNSLGGRVALEIGLRYPERVDRLVLLAPSLAWRRDRPWAPLLRLVRPELGAIQPAPRAVVERIVARVVPGAEDGWTAAGIDEFLRAYLTPAGRAAFYAAARQIYLEEPEGADGFWPRLRSLDVESLFVWGRRDRLVPLAFARHVTDAVPSAAHLELDCGHVPQLERPRETHAATRDFVLRGRLAKSA
jgi:pimeloyl-ACP methyl ester carboxylesterase